MANDREEVRITGVPTNVKKELDNIADNLGTTVSALLKPKLREIADSYSQNLKQPVKKD